MLWRSLQWKPTIDSRHLAQCTIINGQNVWLTLNSTSLTTKNCMFSRNQKIMFCHENVQIQSIQSAFSTTVLHPSDMMFYPTYEHKMRIIMVTQGGVFSLPAGLPRLTVWRNHRHLLRHLHHGGHLRPRVAHICYFCTEGRDQIKQ